MPPDDWVHQPSAAAFGIRYKEASGSSVADDFKQELGGKLWLTVPQCPHFPYLFGLSDGLMVSTGELGSWLLYLDKILDPSPSLFAVIAGLCVDSVGGKGKVKAKSKGSASIHLTEWVNGNKWLSFDQLYIHLFSVTTVKDTGAYLNCIPALIKWKQSSGEKKNSITPFCLLAPLSMSSSPSVSSITMHSHHLQLSIIIAWNNA